MLLAVGIVSRFAERQREKRGQKSEMEVGTAYPARPRTTADHERPRRRLAHTNRAHMRVLVTADAAHNETATGRVRTIHGQIKLARPHGSHEPQSMDFATGKKKSNMDPLD